MLMRKLKTAGASNYCRKAFVMFHGSDTSLMSCGVVICTLKKNGTLIMRCKDEELSVADKRHLKTFIKRFMHRMS